MTAHLEGAPPRHTALSIARASAKAAIWLVATASVAALFVMSRDGSARSLETSSEPSRSEPPSRVDGHSRLFRLESQERLAASTCDDPHVLRLEWISGSLTNPIVEEWTHRFSGIPRSLAMADMPEPALFVLVELTEGRTSLVKLQLDPATKSSREIDLISFPLGNVRGMGGIVDFELTSSGDAVILLYEPVLGSSSYALISVEIGALLRPGVHGEASRVSKCPTRKLAARIDLPSLEAVDLEVAEEGKRWSIRLTPSGPTIDVDLEAEESAPSELDRVVAVG